jgi:RHS repeat-associated protein
MYFYWCSLPGFFGGRILRRKRTETNERENLAMQDSPALALVAHCVPKGSVLGASAGNAHRYDELASGRMYVESDPIGLDGGSFSTYAYADGNPVTNFDPTGLASCGFFDCPSLPQGVVNASAGIGDALLLNQGARLRQLLNINGGVDTCSSSYKGGQLAGIVATLATGEGEVTILSNAAHYAPRLIEAGVDVAEAQAAVVGELEAMQAALAEGESLGSLSQRITVGGKLVQYNAYPLPGGIINVGTIFPVL